MNTDIMSAIVKTIIWFIVLCYIAGGVGIFLNFLLTGQANRGW